jgi:hypothetical protein
VVVEGCHCAMLRTLVSTTYMILLVYLVTGLTALFSHCISDTCTNSISACRVMGRAALLTALSALSSIHYNTLRNHCSVFAAVWLAVGRRCDIASSCHYSGKLAPSVCCSGTSYTNDSFIGYINTVFFHNPLSRALLVCASVNEDTGRV